MGALGLDGAPNARDLAGLVGVDGRTIQPGLLLRAPALGRLTDADVETLRRLGPRTVIDLRHPSEVAASPPDRLPEPAPRVIAVPIYDPAHPVFTYVSAVLAGEDGASGYAALADEGTPGAMAAIYRWFVSGDLPREQFGTAARVLADPDALPILLHCSVGKDRTGWLTVILLNVLGVSRAAIEADYLATNAATADLQRVLLAAMRERRPDLDPVAVQPVFDARTEYLDAAYGEVERLYGTFDVYLRHGLRLAPTTMDAIRTNLLS